MSKLQSEHAKRLIDAYNNWRRADAGKSIPRVLDGKHGLKRCAKETPDLKCVVIERFITTVTAWDALSNSKYKTGRVLMRCKQEICRAGRKLVLYYGTTATSAVCSECGMSLTKVENTICRDCLEEPAA